MSEITTKLIHSGGLRSEFGETSEALFLNSAYAFKTAEEAEARFAGSLPGYKYGRYSHPNLDMLQTRLCALEGSEAAVVTASGMAAVFAALMCELKAGDHVVAGPVLFSSCHYILTQILPRFGIETTLAATNSVDDFAKAFKPSTKAVFIETPGNPTLGIIDIAGLAKLCKSKGTKLLVDNVFAVMIQKPLELGADVVIYSTTKHIDGQGRTLGGAILGNKDWIENTLLPFVRHTGPHMSHFNAWILLKSLETLPLRLERHNSSAHKIAEFLTKQKQITRVIYPGLPSHPEHAIAKSQMANGGPLVAFEIAGGKAAAFKFMNALKVATISNNLGDAKTLITHPASTTHASMTAEAKKAAGISENLIRLSVGLEAPEDIIWDLSQAFS